LASLIEGIEVRGVYIGSPKNRHQTLGIKGNETIIQTDQRQTVSLVGWSETERREITVPINDPELARWLVQNGKIIDDLDQIHPEDPSGGLRRTHDKTTQWSRFVEWLRSG
jgi:hypothetical protein